jgi:hypothetical protein
MLSKLEQRIRRVLQRTAWFRVAEGEVYKSGPFRGPEGSARILSIEE